MIDEEGYWRAKKRIEQMEKKYSGLAGSSSNEYEKRKWYGVCDGINIALKEFERLAEKPATEISDKTAQEPPVREDNSDLLEDPKE